MSPSNQDIQLQKNCALYAYVLHAQGKEIPEHIQDCTEDYDYSVDCSSQLQKELESLDTETFEKLVKNPQSQKARELAQWWEMSLIANSLHDNLGSTCL